MRVLFVSSGNSYDGISIIVKTQGNSLKHAGIQIDYFPIIGKGFIGYLKSIFLLKKYLRNKTYDIIHAHYSLSAFVATLATKSPIIVSLMGSEIKANYILRSLIKLFAKFKWDAVICKSEGMRKNLKLHRAVVVPNGVDIRKFKIIDKDFARTRVGFEADRKYVIFVADPNRYVKNVELARQAIINLKDSSVVFRIIANEPQVVLPLFMNAADVLLLTSRWEGSPNVIKEAMACNLPIVTTEVGDVKELLSGIHGCYIVSADPDNVAEGLRKVLCINSRTESRKIIKDRLSSEAISHKIIDIYKSVLN